MNEDETPPTAAEIRALAEQAEAEAAEADALASAARARSRAIQLRRQAERAEARSQQTAQQDGAAGVAVAEAHITAPAATEQRATREVDSVHDRSGGGSESADADDAKESAGRLSHLRRLGRPKWSTIAASSAIVIILLALAGAGYMTKEHRDAQLRHQRATEFTAAAGQGVVTMTSLDFHDAKQGVQRIIDNATGSFKDDFLKTADDFIKVVEQSKVVSQGTVQATGVDLDTMTKDSAVVLVGSTQEVTNAAGAKQDPRIYRLIVTVARDGGQLKLSKIEFVP